MGVLLGLLLGLVLVSLGAETISGAGASFPYPLYSRWAYMYQKETGVRVNYQSIGSGGGIRQIRNRTVDFGASDAPLRPEETRRYNLAQFPTVIGGVVIVYNLPLKDLKLSTEAVCGIFLGKVRYWDDPLIRRANPDKKLPHRRISVIRRADGSGTTWIFTHYLSQACPEWREKVGYGKSVNWPVGIGAKGNEGVASYVRRIRGSIGYVEFAYALENGLSYALVQNRAGRFVRPSLESFQEAAKNAEWDPAKDFYEVLTWQPGEGAYPIAGATFVVLAKDYPKERNAKVVRFFDWAFTKGDKVALELHYVPLPPEVKKRVRDYWRSHGWY
jgi:phosphate transport system substrate-binding protein